MNKAVMVLCWSFLLKSNKDLGLMAGKVITSFACLSLSPLGCWISVSFFSSQCWKWALMWFLVRLQNSSGLMKDGGDKLNYQFNKIKFLNNSIKPI